MKPPGGHQRFGAAAARFAQDCAERLRLPAHGLPIPIAASRRAAPRSPRSRSRARPAGRARRRGRCSAWRGAARAAAPARCVCCDLREHSFEIFGRDDSRNQARLPALPPRPSAPPGEHQVLGQALAERCAAGAASRPPCRAAPRACGTIASGVATMKSQAAAISQPEPIAGPCTTAIAGIGRPPAPRRRRRPSCAARAPASSLMPLRSFRSAPAQNTGPLPRTKTSLHVLVVGDRACAAASSPSHIARLSALRLSGRFERDRRDAVGDR